MQKAAISVLCVSLLALLAFAFFGWQVTAFQGEVLRTLFALMLGAFGFLIPGFVNISLKAGSFVRAGGAMALFIVGYIFSPQFLVVGNHASLSLGSLGWSLIALGSIVLNGVAILFGPLFEWIETRKKKSVTLRMGNGTEIKLSGKLSSEHLAQLLGSIEKSSDAAGEDPKKN